MNLKPLFLFLFLLCTAQLAAQLRLGVRGMADSCAKAGNVRVADSLYTCLITYQPEARDYTARAALRRETEPCRACDDLFSAALLGDKNAVNQFKRDCYRTNTTQLCAPDSSSLFYARGKVTMRQKTVNSYFRVQRADTAFKVIRTSYVSGKDTLLLAANSCPMPDSLRFRIYRYIGDNNHFRAGSLLPFVIGYYSNPTDEGTSTLFAVTFSHNGVVLDAQTAGGQRAFAYDDVEIVRLLKALPPLGNWGCAPGAYRFLFTIYFSRQW